MKVIQNIATGEYVKSKKSYGKYTFTKDLQDAKTYGDKRSKIALKTIIQIIGFGLYQLIDVELKIKN
jgi:hypothetical protein